MKYLKLVKNVSKQLAEEILDLRKRAGANSAEDEAQPRVYPRSWSTSRCEFKIISQFHLFTFKSSCFPPEQANSIIFPQPVRREHSAEAVRAAVERVL